MYKIIDRKTYETEEGHNIDVCDIIADTPNDLPSANDISVYNIGMGSWIYIISDGSHRVLNSGGEWV